MCGAGYFNPRIFRLAMLHPVWRPGNSGNAPGKFQKSPRKGHCWVWQAPGSGIVVEGPSKEQCPIGKDLPWARDIRWGQMSPKLVNEISKYPFFNYLRTWDVSCSPPRIWGELGFTFTHPSGEISFLVIPEGHKNRSNRKFPETYRVFLTGLTFKYPPFSTFILKGSKFSVFSPKLRWFWMHMEGEIIPLGVNSE